MDGEAIEVRARVKEGNIKLYVGYPHNLQLCSLEFEQLKGLLEVTSDGFKSAASVAWLELLGRATRVRRQAAPGARAGDGDASFARSTSSPSLSPAFRRRSPTQFRVSTEHSRKGEPELAQLSRQATPRGRCSLTDMETSAPTPGFRPERPAGSSGFQHAASEELDDEELAAQAAAEQPMVQVELNWFPRTQKPGCHRTVSGAGPGESYELLDAEWNGKVDVAPLELMYHHGFVMRLVSYFLNPWETHEEMDMEGVKEQMLFRMDSHLQVARGLASPPPSLLICPSPLISFSPLLSF